MLFDNKIGISDSDAAENFRNWISERIPEADDLKVRKFERPKDSGFSNITILIDISWRQDGTDRSQSLVARVEPVGETLFQHYDVEFQFNVMKKLAQTDVAVPTVLWNEKNPDVLGAPFFVMEHVQGEIPSDDPSFAAPGSWVMSLEPDQRALLVDNGLKSLVAVHQLDWKELGLDFVARTGEGDTSAARELAHYENFYSWAVGTDNCEVIDEAISWAKENLPQGEEVGLSWGDSRIGNMIFDDSFSVVSVIDWEGATLSSPEKDLGHWLHLSRAFTEEFGFALPEGFPSREEVVSRYEELSGRPTANVHFYEVMSGIHGAIQANRALRLMMKADIIPNDPNSLSNNPFTRALAKLIGHELPETGGLATISGSPSR
ncbi:phosphotransferase family protein [Rhodococcus globerulus]|uniref:Phosphotransferase family protein n=1 Tax=Rhodococcus globerulus TaxID=33008 RepID=A0ABU4C2X0_RHOGO|nr:phosphotransferase family protein [Rhodococcus globerulus]MDV6270850.1 phosphotransferase family protein [Rhodococcus globerulus]